MWVVTSRDLLSRSPDRIGALIGALAQASSLHGFGSFPLRNNFSSVELDQHSSIRFDLFDGNIQSEVVEKQELKLEMVKLGQGQAANLIKLSHQ